MAIRNALVGMVIAQRKEAVAITNNIANLAKQAETLTDSATAIYDTFSQEEKDLADGKAAPGLPASPAPIKSPPPQ